MDKKTVLVTGGAGFIGSFLCEALLKEGNRVICIDNFSTGHVHNIEPMLRNPDFQFLRLDINERFDLEAFAELEPFKVKFLGIQEIYHLAMPTAVKGYEQFKMQILLANSAGVRHVLDAAVKYKSRVLLASAGTVYGSRAADPDGVDETELGIVDHLNSRAAVNEGKRFAETMFATYGDVYGIDAKIARIFRTYGPRMPLFQGHQIPDFVLNVLDGKALTIMGDSGSTTALVYVTDIVDGLLRLMRAEKGIGPVNLGSDVNLKIEDVAKKIMAIAEREVGITYEPQLAHMIPLALPNLHKSKDILGWLPLVRLDDGLKKTIDYVRANKLLLTNGG
ncbi:MAG TPA: NAD-dependent epimerase/dehydratase family protein [bacterium]|jgi:UDP-glucuronate decarboxylase|nr:UDP-glucuronate decarboxylase [Patescibacteria group bacterium]HRH32416.1 NAD-dependent epimerase/dehydratase family protein [bacterium]